MMADQIVETPVDLYSLSIKMHHQSSVVDNTNNINNNNNTNHNNNNNNNNNNSRRNKKQHKKSNSLDHITNSKTTYDLEDTHGEPNDHNTESTCNIKNKSNNNSSNLATSKSTSSPRVPRISLSILTGGSSNSSSGDTSPLEAKSRSPQQRTPRSSPSTPKKSKAKMEGTPNLSPASESSSSSNKYSPLSLISPRKKGKKEKNRLNHLQSSENIATPTPATTQTSTTTTTPTNTTPAPIPTTTTLPVSNSVTNPTFGSNISSNFSFNDDVSSSFNNSTSSLESPLSSSITASVSTDSLRQHLPVVCEESQTPPNTTTTTTTNTTSEDLSVQNPLSLPLAEDSNSTPSSSNSTPLLTNQTLNGQENPAPKKRFFSFLSRKPKIPPTMSIERKTSPPLPINSATTTPQALSTNTTPNLIPMASISYQQQQMLQPRRMSTSLDSMKSATTPAITPNFPFSPVVSPVVPPSPLKTSILRNRSNSSSFYPSNGGGNLSLSTSGIRKIEYNSLHYSQSNSFLQTSIINSPINPNNNTNAIGSQISIATDATWLMIASNWEEWSEPHYRSTLTKYIYQGIPDRFRQTIWFNLSNMIQQTARIPTCTELSLQYKLERFQPQLTPLSTPSNQTPISTPLIRSQVISNTEPSYSPPSTSICKNHKCFYQSILKHPSEHQEQIDVDIQRSFTDIPDNIRESYSMSLKRVLKAISLYDSEMGYCQGISFVGSILITKVPEEETFHILLRLLEGVMRDFYTVGMMGLKLRLFQLSKFVQDLFPKLHKHLESIDLDYTIFASPWFLTAFSYHLSDECVVRILDVILLQGVEAFFSVGLAIFQIIEADLLKCTDSSQAMEYFRCNAKNNIDVTTLMDIASRITVSPHQLSNFKSQFEAHNTKPSIPTEFNPDQQPKQKLKDPNWVVKKYQLKEYINNLEEDLAVIKRELHETSKKNEEEKIELVKHLQELSDRESQFIEQKRTTDSNYLAILQENEELKKKLHKSEECNNFLADQMRVLRSKVTQELWNNNPKNSIQWT